MIDPATQAEILRLYFSEKKSQRAIAFDLGLHRQTVAAVIRRRAIAETSSQIILKPSMLQPFYDQIEQLLKKDPARSAVNILQSLRLAGYTGGVSILKDYLRTCRPSSEPKAFLSLDFLPGQTAQADWGDFGDVFGLGRKVWCFVMVLCWSRLLYLEFTLSANFESFLRCHEHAFEFFGGVTHECWYDNLATAVAERKGKIVRFNPRFLVYAGTRGFKPVACNLAAGWEKGRVEDGVKFVRQNFWPGRSFTGHHDLNGQARVWLNQFANKRTHAITRKIPELAFLEEKTALHPLREPYDCDEVRSPSVSPQFRVSFDSNEYTVPWRLANSTVTLRANQDEVSIYYGHRRVARHARCWLKNEQIKNPCHEEGLLEEKPGAQPDADTKAIADIGPNARQYLKFLPAQTNSLRSEIRQLMVLITVYGANAVESVIGRAITHGVVGHAHLERWLDQTQNIQKKPLPLSFNDPRLTLPHQTPDLTSYDSRLLAPEPDTDTKDTTSQKEHQS